MKRNLLSIIFLATTLVVAAQNPRMDSVTMGTNYPYDVYYNLSTGDRDTFVNKNWHIAFAARPAQPPANVMRSTTIKTNASRGVVLYKSAFTSSQWNSFDTTGYKTWQVMENGDSSWDIAAFNSDFNPSNPFDFGWGQYDMNTHNVKGTKMYLMQITSGSALLFKKITIQELAYDSLWLFTYSNIDGTDSTTQSINKNAYKGKLFAYHNVITKTTMDREPNRPWDLLFTFYRTFATFPPYPSMAFNFKSVLQAPQLSVARVVGIPKATADTINATNYSKRMSTIGWDWKRVYLGPPPSGPYDMTDSLTYFIKRDKDSVIFKMTFDKFVDNPQVIGFNLKTINMMHTGIANVSNIKSDVLVYPNPATQFVTISLPTSINKKDVSISVMDMMGKSIVTKSNIQSNDVQIDLTQCSKGIYFISINADGLTSTQKLIVE